MTSEKDVEALGGTEEEKVALKDADGSLSGMGDSHPDANDSRTRFISGNDKKSEKDEAEVYVDINGKSQLEDEFVGLSKDELMKYADDPYWKKVRLALMIIFWVGWCGMLVAAIIIIVLAPKCPPRPKLDWWQTASFYSVVPASFKDSNGDGIGDFNGIHQNLDYLQGSEDSLNVTALQFNPIFPHGGMNNGYDATDFFAVTKEFGTMEEFDELKVAMHKKNMKLMIPFLPNHSSDKHPWFVESIKKTEEYKDFYVWHAGKDGGNSPPNNWQCIDGSGSAWTKHPERGEYYLHQWSASRPDINARNPAVQDKYDEILRFWMKKGVDGFNAEGVSVLFECANFTDENLIDPDGGLNYHNMEHTCSEYQPESFEIVTRWRAVIDEYAAANDKVILLMVNNQGTNNQTAQFYEYGGEKGNHMSFSRNLLNVGKGCEAQCMYKAIDDWISMTEPHGYWNNWRTSNPHYTRVVSRYDNERDYINAMNLLQTTLPGTVFAYYGEEIGMHDLDVADLPPDNHPYDVQQTPLQWSPAEFAGFTEGNSTWVPIPDDYKHYNIRTQKAHGGSTSNLEVFQSFIKIREEPSMQWGTLSIGVTDNVLFYVRQAEGFPGFLVAINFGPTTSTVDFVTNAPEDAKIPSTGVVVATTANFPNSGSDFDIGTEADLTNLILEDAQGAVFKWEKDAIEA